jgi:hypothetical protein
MSDKEPLNVYDPHGDDYDFEDVEEVDTRGPMLGGFAGAGLAILSLIIVIGLCSTLVHRDKSSITISHLCMAIIGVLIAAGGVVFLLMWKKHVEQGGKLNWLVYGIVFVLVVLMACYCLASAVYVYMYRPFHFGKLSTYNEEEWKDRFIDTWDFQRGWKEDRRIIWWMTFFTALAGLGFLILAISMWIAAANKVPLAKMLLAVACFTGLLLALFALHYLWRTHQTYHNNLGSSFNKTYMWMFGIMLVIGIVIFLANLVVNVLKKKGLYFLFGFIWVFYMVVFVVFLGLILRSMRQAQFSNISDNANCPAALGSIHMNSVAEFCPSGKYLPSGQTCYKNFMVREWENTKKPVRFLNPGCCKAMVNQNLWPFYILGCFGLLILSAIMAAIVANFYLGDTRDYLTDFDKGLGIIELAMLGLAVLALIAFGFWFGFMPAAKTLSRDKYNVAANSDGTYSDNNFTPVNLGKVYNGNIPDNASLSSAPPRAADTKEDPVSLKTSSSILKLTPKTTCDEKCKVRVALLAVNGKIERPSGVNFAPNTTKKAFFDGAPADSDYALVTGTEAEVSSFLNGLKVTSQDMTKHTDLYMRAAEVTDGSVWTDGLTSAESVSTFKTPFNAGQYNITNANDDCHLTNSCTSTLACDFNTVSTCNKGFRFYNHGEDVTVTVPYKTKDASGNTIPFKGWATVTGQYDQWENNTRVKPEGASGTNLDKVNVDGNVVFKVPQPYRQDFDLEVEFMDNESHYSREKTIVTVPMKSAKTITTDDVMLLTSDGRYCAGSVTPTEADCWAKKEVKTGTVSITARDASTNALVEGARLELFEDESLSNSAMMTATTSSQGKADFPNMAYDKYYVKYNGSTKFLPTAEQVLLQGTKNGENGELTLFLQPRENSSAVLSEYMNPGENKDLAVNVYDPLKKSTCTVDATSKYCAYMTLEDDVDGAQAGYERVKINKFTESYYLAYKKPTPAYSTSCNYKAHGGARNYYEDNVPTTIRSLADKFDWSSVRKASSTTFETLYCFTGWGLNSKKNVRVVGTAEPTAKALCPGMYPSGTVYALDRLHSLNNQ